MPEELPPEVREHHGEAIDEFNSERDNAEREYKNKLDQAFNYFKNDPAGFRRAKAEAVSTRDNTIMNSYNDLLKKISTGDNPWIPPEAADFLSSKSLGPGRDAGPGKDYRQKPNGSPENGNGWNRPERSLDTDLPSTAYDHNTMRKKYNEYLDKLGGKTPDIPFTNWTRDVLGKGPKTKFDKVLKDRLGSKKYNELQRHVKDMQDAVKSSEKSYDPKKSTRWDPKDKAKFEEASKNIDRLLKNLGDDWDKQRDKDNAMSGDPSKVGGNPKTKTRLEMIYKIMSLLSVLGLGIFAFVTLEQYCANHTGCLKIQYSGSGATQNNIYPCNSKNSTNPNKSVYLPAQCYCSQFTKADNPSSGCECGAAHACSSGEEPPWIKFTADNTAAGNEVCSPNPDGSPPTDGGAWTYYSYQTMTPIDAALDIGGKTLQLGSDLLKIIIHAAIVIGIILGVLLVLWIIYKVVANRKPAETLKIETPSTVSKFGNRGYLGNLSKYSNYAFMGRCVAQPTRPYIPYRFKF
jgi:hypothetical protein